MEDARQSLRTHFMFLSLDLCFKTSPYFLKLLRRTLFRNEAQEGFIGQRNFRRLSINMGVEF